MNARLNDVRTTDDARYPRRQWHADRTFERFTDRARRALVLAQEEARLLDDDFVGTEHLLLGLIHEGEGLAARALGSLGITLEPVREKVEAAVRHPGTGRSGSPPFTRPAKRVLELALREALQLGHNYIGTEHILLGIVREDEGVAAQVLRDLTGGDRDGVRTQVLALIGTGRTGKDLPDDPAGEPRGGSVVRTGVRWRLEVVQAGRTPEAFEAASRQLAGLAGRLADGQPGEVDPSAVTVRSVEPDQGPGLQLTMWGPPPAGPAPGAPADEDQGTTAGQPGPDEAPGAGGTGDE